ncbi:hypothetical protein FOZ62_015009, partial [Perkinsus olseni]
GSVPTATAPAEPAISPPPTATALPQPEEVVNTAFGIEGCFAIQDGHGNGGDQFMETGSHPVATKVCVAPHLLADAILDSGAGRCYGQARYMKWLAAQPGVQLSWNNVAGGNAVGPVGNSLD